MTAIPLYQQVKGVVQGLLTRGDVHFMSQEEADKDLEWQCMLAAEADSKDVSLQEFMDDAFEIIDDWTA